MASQPPERRAAAEATRRINRYFINTKNSSEKEALTEAPSTQLEEVKAQPPTPEYHYERAVTTPEPGTSSRYFEEWGYDRRLYKDQASQTEKLPLVKGFQTEFFGTSEDQAPSIDDAKNKQLVFLPGHVRFYISHLSPENGIGGTFGLPCGSSSISVFK
jgi:hypothetical protein